MAKSEKVLKAEALACLEKKGSTPVKEGVTLRREKSGILRLYVWDASKKNGGNWRKTSLGHKDEEAGYEAALVEASRLLLSRSAYFAEKVTLTVLLDKFYAARKDSIGQERKLSILRASKLLAQSLGDTLVANIDEAVLTDYCSKRMSGEYTLKVREPGFTPRKSRGAALRTKVSPRSVQSEIQVLAAACNWGYRQKGSDGRPLVPFNPTKGFQIPKLSEYAPVRVVMPLDYLAKMLEHADQADPQRRFKYFLRICGGLGWRQGSIRCLTGGHFNLKAEPGAPYGRVNKTHDKMGVERWVVMPKSVREALDELFAEHGRALWDTLLFPRQGDAAHPWTKANLFQLWKATENAAGLEHVPHMGTHSLRRLWACTKLDQKYTIDDIAAAGDWKSVATVRIYAKVSKRRADEVMLDEAATA